MAAAKSDLAAAERALDRHRSSYAGSVLPFGRHVGATFIEAWSADHSYATWAKNLLDARGDMRDFQRFCEGMFSLGNSVAEARRSLETATQKERSDEAIKLKRMRMSTAAGQLALLPEEIIVLIAGELSCLRTYAALALTSSHITRSLRPHRIRLIAFFADVD